MAVSSGCYVIVLVWLVLAGLGCEVGFAQPQFGEETHRILSPRYEARDKPVIEFHDGFFAGYDNDPVPPVFYAYDRSGKLLFEKPFIVDGAVKVRLTAVTAASGGRQFAVGGYAQTAGETAKFIALLDTAGNTQSIIRTTGSFAPLTLRFGPGGRIWAVGISNQEPHNIAGPEHDLLRVYEPDGRLVRQTLPRKAFCAPEAKGCPHPGTAMMAANSNQMALSFPGQPRLYRFDKDGQLVSQDSLPGSSRHSALALLSDGTIVTSYGTRGPDGKPNRSIVAARGPNDTAWSELASLPFLKENREDMLSIVGQEGDQVVARSSPGVWRWFRVHNQPK